MSSVEHLRGAAVAVADDVLARLTALRVHAQWRSDELLGGTVARGALILQAEAGTHELPAVISATVSPTDLVLLPHDARTVLLTRFVSPARAQALFDAGWGGFADTAGNVSLRTPGLLIEISGKQGSSPGRAHTAAPFTRTGLPVTFAALEASVVGDQASQRDLGETSGASIGTVNRVVRALRERTPPMLDKNNHVLRPSALEDEWVAAYAAMQPRAWPEERFTSDLWTEPSDLFQLDLPAGALFGSELAAVRLGAPLRPSEALIHLPPGYRREFIRRGRLRTAPDGPIRIRPTFWEKPPESAGDVAPRPLLRADLLLEDDPRIDEIRAQLFGDRE